MGRLIRKPQHQFWGGTATRPIRPDALDGGSCIDDFGKKNQRPKRKKRPKDYSSLVWALIGTLIVTALILM